MMKEEAEDEEEKEGGALCCAALCAGGSSCPAAVLLGSPSVWQAANHSAGKQCHFSSVCQNEQGREEIQRCKEDEIGERGMRGGEDGNGRRQEEKRRETALHPHLRIEQQQPAPFPQSCAWRRSIPAAASACRETTKENTCMLMSHLCTCQQQEGQPISHFLFSLPLSPVISPSDAHK